MWDWAFFIVGTFTVAFLAFSVVWLVYVLAVWVKEKL